MGNSDSRGAPDLGPLPTQEVRRIGGGGGWQGGGSGVPATAPMHTAMATHQDTKAYELPFYWDKESITLDRVPGSRTAWQLSAAFTCKQPCELSAHFHCTEAERSAGLEFQPADSHAPPSFSESFFAAGSHRMQPYTIELQKHPLRIFWEYSAKTRDTFPIVLSLTASGDQVLMYLSLQQARERGVQARVLRQRVVVQGKPYPVEEIYGLAELGKHDDSENPCVVCLTDARDAVLLPCRHMVVCKDCAGALQARGDKCPICRSPVKEIQTWSVNS